MSLPGKAFGMLVEWLEGLRSDSKCVLETEPGELDIKRREPGSKLDIKRREPDFLFISYKYQVDSLL